MQKLPTLADARKKIPKGGLMAPSLRNGVTIGGKGGKGGMAKAMGIKKGSKNFKNVGF